MRGHSRSMLLVIAAATFGTASLHAQERSLEVEIAQLAKDIQTALPASDLALTVGKFKASSRLPATAGPAITLALRRELAKQGIAVRDGARLRVEGEYRDVIDQASGGLAVALIARFVDNKEGKAIDPPIKLKPRGIFGDASISALLGLSVEFSPNSSRKERDEALKLAIDKPSAKLHTANYQPNIPAERLEITTPSSKFRIEILTKDGGDYVPRSAQLRDGEAFVRIERNEIYAVRLINDYDFEIAVQLSIDGLSLFAFADGLNSKTAAAPHGIIVAAKSKGMITGWYRNPKEINEFQVTEYARSAAAELNNVAANVGSITATYCASWPENGSPPDDEPRMPPRYARSAEATARGQIIQEASEIVDRKFGVVRGSVTVRYSK